MSRISTEEKLASIFSILDLLTNVDDNVNLESIRTSALLAMIMLRDLKVQLQTA